MVSVPIPRVSGKGLSHARGHRVVFLGKTLNSRSASLQPGVFIKWVPANCWGNLTNCRGSDLRWTSILSRETRERLATSCYKNWDKLQQL